MKKSLTKVAHEIFGLTAQQIREGGPGAQELPGQQPAEAQVGDEIGAVFKETYDAEGPEGLIALAYSTQPAEVQAEMKGMLESDPDGTIDLMVKALTASPEAVSAWIAFTSELAPADDAPLDEPASGSDAEAPMEEQAQEEDDLDGNGNGQCMYCGNGCEPGESVCDSDECIAEDNEENGVEKYQQEHGTADEEFKPGELIEPINTHGMATGQPVMVSGIKHGQVLVGRHSTVLGPVAHVAKNYRKKAQSQNREWGFFGTVKRNQDLTDGMVEQVWDVMVSTLLNLVPGADQAGVENFLDSVYGRHLADDLSRHGAGKGSAESVIPAIDQWSGSGQGKWVAKAYAETQEGRVAQSQWAPSADDLYEYAMNVPAMYGLLHQVRADDGRTGGLSSLEAARQIIEHYNAACNNPDREYKGSAGELEAVIDLNIHELTARKAQADNVEGILDYLVNSLEHVYQDQAVQEMVTSFGVSQRQAEMLVKLGYEAMSNLDLSDSYLRSKIEQALGKTAKTAYDRKTVGWAIACDTQYQMAKGEFKLDVTHWSEDANLAAVYATKEEAQAAIDSSPEGDEFVGRENMEPVSLHEYEEGPEFEASARVAVDAKTLDYFKAYFGEYGAQLTRPIALKKQAMKILAQASEWEGVEITRSVRDYGEGLTGQVFYNNESGNWGYELRLDDEMIVGWNNPDTGVSIQSDVEALCDEAATKYTIGSIK